MKHLQQRQTSQQQQSQVEMLAPSQRQTYEKSDDKVIFGRGLIEERKHSQGQHLQSHPFSKPPVGAHHAPSHSYSAHNRQGSELVNQNPDASTLYHHQTAVNSAKLLGYIDDDGDTGVGEVDQNPRSIKEDNNFKIKQESINKRQDQSQTNGSNGGNDNNPVNQQQNLMLKAKNLESQLENSTQLRQRKMKKKNMSINSVGKKILHMSSGTKSRMLDQTSESFNTDFAVVEQECQSQQHVMGQLAKASQTYTNPLQGDKMKELSNSGHRSNIIQLKLRKPPFIQQEVMNITDKPVHVVKQGSSSAGINSEALKDYGYIDATAPASAQVAKQEGGGDMTKYDFYNQLTSEQNCGGAQQSSSGMMTGGSDSFILTQLNGNGVSIYEQIEEVQFLSYEHSNKLRHLIDEITQSIVDNPSNQMTTMGMEQTEMIAFLEQLDHLKDVALDASHDFETMQVQLKTFFDRMQDEVNGWKAKCAKLYKQLQSAKNPKNAINTATFANSNINKHQQSSSSSQVQLQYGTSKSLGRPPAQKQSRGLSSRLGRVSKGSASRGGSLNHSGILQSNKKRLQMFNQSLIEIVNVYDKNRTQIYSNLEEIESRVNEFKNTREKLNVQHLGTMTTVEQEMEQLCLRSARSQKSQLVSHRSHSASKRHQQISQEASKRSIRNNQEDNFKVTKQSKPKDQQQQQSTTVQGASDPKQTNERKVPPLPIHMVTNSNQAPNPAAGKTKTPSKGQQPQQQQYSKNLNSARSAASKPPPPESYRSYRSQRSNSQKQQKRKKNVPPPINKPFQQQNNEHLSVYQNQNSEQVGNHSSNAGGYVLDSARASQKNISGALVEGCVVNGLMLQNAPIGTSKFDKGLECSFSGDEETILFDTQRLAQFGDDYEQLQSLDDTDQKILVKQILFMKYERELKRQIKEEKELRREQRRNERERRGQDGEHCEESNHHTRRQSSIGNGSYIMNSNRSHQSGSKQKGKQLEKDVKLSQILNISAIQLDSSLSEIGTSEMLNAAFRERYNNQDVSLNQVLAVSQDIPGLKTVTQKDLQFIADKNWQQQQKLREENRKILAWSSGEEDNNNNNSEQKSFEMIGVVSSKQLIGGHQKNKHFIPPLNVPNSPGKQQMFGNQISTPSAIEPDDEAQIIGQKPQKKSKAQEQQINQDKSFNNSSLNYDDFVEQLSPSKLQSGVNNVGQIPFDYQSSKLQQNIQNYESKNLNQSDMEQDTNNLLHQNLNHPSDINLDMALQNASATSDECSMYLKQKKTLEVITERQSEFSNTMNTQAARPSNRSRASKNQSSNAKTKASITMQAINPGVNGSATSFNNSSLNIASGVKRPNQQAQFVQSFADLAASDLIEDQNHQSSVQAAKGNNNSRVIQSAGKNLGQPTSLTNGQQPQRQILLNPNLMVMQNTNNNGSLVNIGDSPDRIQSTNQANPHIQNSTNQHFINQSIENSKSKKPMLDINQPLNLDTSSTSIQNFNTQNQQMRVGMACSKSVERSRTSQQNGVMQGKSRRAGFEEFTVALQKKLRLKSTKQYQTKPKEISVPQSRIIRPQSTNPASSSASNTTGMASVQQPQGHQMDSIVRHPSEKQQPRVKKTPPVQQVKRIFEGKITKSQGITVNRAQQQLNNIDVQIGPNQITIPQVQQPTTNHPQVQQMKRVKNSSGSALSHGTEVNLNKITIPSQKINNISIQ